MPGFSDYFSYVCDLLPQVTPHEDCPRMYELTPMQADHLPRAHRLSAEELWPHQPEDWAFMLRLGDGLVALRGDEICGTILWWRHAASVATLGMVLVGRNHRGCGLGRRLVAAAQEVLRDTPCWLCATPEGLPLYTKRGFEPTEVIVKCVGRARSQDLPPATQPCRVGLSNAAELGDVIDLDAVARGWARPGLIRALAELAEFHLLHRDGKITGYAATRPFDGGQVIGPIAAASQADARALIRSALVARPGQISRIDTPEHHGLVPWLAEIGLPRKGGGTAMMANAPLSLRRSAAPRLFGLISQALG